MQLYVLKTDNTLGQQVEFNTKKGNGLRTPTL